MEVLFLAMAAVWFVLLLFRELSFKGDKDRLDKLVWSLEQRVRDLENYRGYDPPDDQDDWKLSVYRDDD